MDARQRVVKFVESRSARQLFIVLFLLTIVVRLGLFFALHRQQVILRSEVEHVAMSLARDGSFGSPYRIPTGPTAHVAPIYPFVLSFAYRLFGTGIEAEWADQSFSVVCVAVVFG